MYMIRQTLLALSVLVTSLPHAPSAQASYAAEWFDGNWNCKIGNRTAQMNWRMAQDAPNSKYIGKFRENGSNWTPISEVARYYRVLQMRFDQTNVNWSLTYSPDRNSPSRGVATGTTIIQGQSQPISCTKGSLLDEPITPTDVQPPAQQPVVIKRKRDQSNILNPCKPGYVLRKAQTSDRVCVTPQVRAQTQDENALANSRREANGGPYGPDTCKQDYVWREATPDDHVCVTPQVRSQAAEDNQRAAERLIPKG
jgi:Family of unknown function (DUF6006)